MIYKEEDSEFPRQTELKLLEFIFILSFSLHETKLLLHALPYTPDTLCSQQEKSSSWLCQVKHLLSSIILHLRSQMELRWMKNESKMLLEKWSESFFGVERHSLKGHYVTTFSLIFLHHIFPSNLETHLLKCLKMFKRDREIFICSLFRFFIVRLIIVRISVH